MNVLHRDEFLSFARIFSAEVPIDPTKTREALFDEWIAALRPSCCGRHQRTRLVLDYDASKVKSLSCENSDNWYRRHMSPECHVPDRETREKLYAFEAVYRCPACHVEYALCPPEFRETSFDTFNTSTPERTAALAKAREFAAQVNARGCGFALFVGMPGTGKTRLACNAVRALNNNDVLYVRQSQLTRALRATYGRKDVILHRAQRQDQGDLVLDEESPTPVAIVQKVRFLILDEIGCVSLADDERLLLDELLKYRYEHRKPTILVSNLPLTGTTEQPGLKEYLGDALVDRIREATGNGKFIVQFTGISYRLAVGGNYLDGPP